ncbi:MAG: hypothetical protein HPY68_08360 [Candidatus Atribacteria bacterium]|nr:hypothetical protein [Candidatus Atribacteria bacterium]
MQKITVIGLVLVLFLFTFSGPARPDSWQEVPGPTVKLIACVEPFVKLEISSEYYDNGTPVVRFLCDRGPGTYDGNPLTVKLTTNVQAKLYCDATDLAGEGEAIIPVEQLSVRFDDPDKLHEPFHYFKNKEDKGIMIYNSPKPVSVETKCYFRIDITAKERAGEYNGQAFFTVLYKL